MSEWFSIEVRNGDTPARSWADAYGDALVGAGLGAGAAALPVPMDDDDWWEAVRPAILGPAELPRALTRTCSLPRS